MESENLISNYKILLNKFERSDLLVKSISLDDDMGLAADMLDIELFNDNEEYLDQFVQGDELNIDFFFEDGRSLSTGSFYIDTIGGSIGTDTTHRLGSVSMPTDRPGLRKQMSYARKEVGLKTLLTDVCKVADLDLVYRLMKNPAVPWDVKLKNISHADETAGGIIQEYAETFGCFIKLHNNQLVFSDKKSFASDGPVYLVDPRSDVIENFSYEMKWRLDKEYDVFYYNPKNGKVTEDKKTRKSNIVTKSETVKRINSKIADPDMARAIAMSIDDQIVFSVSFNMVDNPLLMSGNVIRIDDLKSFSGNYLIVRSRHDFKTSWYSGVQAVSLF